MDCYTNLAELQEASIRIYDGMSIAFSNSVRKMIFEINFDKKILSGSIYEASKDNLLFSKECSLYLTRNTRTAIQLLETAEYISCQFLTPLLDGGYPENEKEKWNMIIKLASQIKNQEFRDDCMQFCKQVGIGKIPSILLDTCLKIPNTFMVTNEKGISYMYHSPFSPSFSVRTSSFLGTYCCYENYIFFVNCDGQLYACPSRDILHYLSNNGYKEKKFSIPFVNDYVPMDTILRKQWHALLLWWSNCRQTN